MTGAAAHALAYDVETGIARQMSALLIPGDVHELRALGVTLPGETPRAALSGFYDNVAALARDAASLDGWARGIYFTLNPLVPEALRRAPNRLDRRCIAANDADVLRRRWLPIDLDPVRPKDTNATDEELAAAVARGDEVWSELRRKGWPEPVSAISGNGAHLLFPCDLPRDDNGAIRNLLGALSKRFSDDRVKLDPSVSNPSRIWKLYGTLTCKSEPVPDRPRRRAVILSTP